MSGSLVRLANGEMAMRVVVYEAPAAELTADEPASGPTGSSRILSAAADTNATVAKASAGRLHSVQVNNAAGHVIYLKFYNKATAPTVGTDVPVITVALATGVNSLDMGRHYFSTGIAYGCVVGGADNDTTALTAADFLGLNVQYS